MNKKTYAIQYLQTAQRDLLEIIDYIKLDNPTAAKAFAEKIDKHISNLSRFPKTVKIPNNERLKRLGYRILPIDHYLVFYVITGQIVQIRRVINGARRYEFLL